MADVQTTRTPNPVNANVTAGEPIGRVNVYDNNTAQAAPNPSLDGHTTYATEPAPVTSSSPGLMTWILILAVIILALYFVVQFLT
jgi:hypothetical protein